MVDVTRSVGCCCWMGLLCRFQREAGSASQVTFDRCPQSGAYLRKVAMVFQTTCKGPSEKGATEKPPWGQGQAISREFGQHSKSDFDNKVLFKSDGNGRGGRKVDYWFINCPDIKAVKFPGDGVVFRCYKNDELWLCVHFFFLKNMLEILLIQFLYFLYLTSFGKSSLRPYSYFPKYSVGWIFQADCKEGPCSPVLGELERCGEGGRGFQEMGAHLHFRRISWLPWGHPLCLGGTWEDRRGGLRLLGNLPQ